ncbi:sodium/glucose cotransporter 4 [Glossophaga mutica]
MRGKEGSDPPSRSWEKEALPSEQDATEEGAPGQPGRYHRCGVLAVMAERRLVTRGPVLGWGRAEPGELERSRFQAELQFPESLVQGQPKAQGGTQASEPELRLLVFISCELQVKRVPVAGAHRQLPRAPDLSSLLRECTRSSSRPGWKQAVLRERNGARSSLTSIFNSSSTLFAIDVWQRFRRKATEQELMVVGRVFVVFLVVVSILWIPITQSSNSGQLFDYSQSVTSYLALPITALFLLAIFCKRVTEPGAFWGLMFGLVVGLVRMILEFSYPAPACGEVDRRPAVVFKDFHYLYSALVLCGLTAIVIVTVSLCTTLIPEEKLARLTWWTQNCPPAELEKEAQEGTAGRVQIPRGEPPTGGGGADNRSQGPKQELGGRLSLGKLLWGWLCGLSGALQRALRPAEEAELEQKLISIKEEPLWRSICNVNAVLLPAVNVFLWGYFA